VAADVVAAAAVHGGENILCGIDGVDQKSNLRRTKSSDDVGKGNVVFCSE
jgi:hypothetical protein